MVLCLYLSAPGSIQATNKESIQKLISRLDEDLSTLGQISKLSETLSFPHQVPWRAAIPIPLLIPKGILKKENMYRWFYHPLSCLYSFPSLSVSRWGDQRSDGVSAQGAVRETVCGLQYDLPAHKAGVHHSLSWEHLRLWIYLAWRTLQLWAGFRGSQEETRSLNKRYYKSQYHCLFQ